MPAICSDNRPHTWTTGTRYPEWLDQIPADWEVATCDACDCWEVRPADGPAVVLRDPRDAESLDELLALLQTGLVHERVMSELPEFGGAPLDGGHGPVWSWDETRALVGSGTDDLKIVARADAPYLKEAA